MPMLHQRRFKITVLTELNELDEFYTVAYVAWDHIKELMSEEEHARFSEWMRGQTVIAEGCYPHDLERFLAKKPIID